MTPPDRSALSRRDYVRALVAAGGATALSACLDATSDGESEPAVPAGTDDPDALPERQHAWDESLPGDGDGNVRPAEHHALVPLSLVDGAIDGDGVDAEAREVTEAVLGSLERAYEWSADGLLFTIGYTPAYFARFDDPLPDAVDLPEPEPLATTSHPTSTSSTPSSTSRATVPTSFSRPRRGCSATARH